MKKLLALALPLAALLLTACGSSTTNATDSVKSELSKRESSISSSIASTLTQATSGGKGATKTADGGFSKDCTVSGVPNVNPTSVKVAVTAKGSPAAVSSLIACPSAKGVVRVVANLKAQKPIRVGPFQCTPVVQGNSTDFTCSFTAANSISATYKFALHFKG